MAKESKPKSKDKKTAAVPVPVFAAVDADLAVLAIVAYELGSSPPPAKKLKVDAAIDADAAFHTASFSFMQHYALLRNSKPIVVNALSSLSSAALCGEAVDSGGSTEWREQVDEHSNRQTASQSCLTEPE